MPRSLPAAPESAEFGSAEAERVGGRHDQQTSRLQYPQAFTKCRQRVVKMFNNLAHGDHIETVCRQSALCQVTNVSLDVVTLGYLLGSLLIEICSLDLPTAFLHPVEESSASAADIQQLAERLAGQGHEPQIVGFVFKSVRYPQWRKGKPDEAMRQTKYGFAETLAGFARMSMVSDVGFPEFVRRRGGIQPINAARWIGATLETPSPVEITVRVCNAGLNEYAL